RVNGRSVWFSKVQRNFPVTRNAYGSIRNPRPGGRRTDTLGLKRPLKIELDRLCIKGSSVRKLQTVPEDNRDISTVPRNFISLSKHPLDTGSLAIITCYELKQPAIYRIQYAEVGSSARTGGRIQSSVPRSGRC